jgi:hypothetical protein
MHFLSTLNVLTHLSPYENPMIQTLLSHFTDNKGTERLSNVPQVTQLVSGKTGSQA